MKPKKNETRADFLERCIEELFVNEKVKNVSEAQKECLLIWNKNKQGEK